MSSLVVLGDSFAEIRPNIDYVWQLQLSQKLKLDLVNIAHNGASSEWLMLKISQYLEGNLTRSDRLVVIIPFWERICIWPDRPDLTNNYPLESLDKDWVKNTDKLPDFIKKKLDGLSLKEKTAFDYYFKHLKNDELTILKSSALLNWINNIGSNLDNPPIIIDSHCFVEHSNCNLENCVVAKGSLFPVCENEFASKDVFFEYTNTGPFNDFRAGHFSECNHTILAEKIYNTMINDCDLDITQGFYEGFVDLPGTQTKSWLQKVRDVIK